MKKRKLVGLSGPPVGESFQRSPCIFTPRSPLVFQRSSERSIKVKPPDFGTTHVGPCHLGTITLCPSTFQREGFLLSLPRCSPPESLYEERGPPLASHHLLLAPRHRAVSGSIAAYPFDLESARLKNSLPELGACSHYCETSTSSLSTLVSAPSFPK